MTMMTRAFRSFRVSLLAAVAGVAVAMGGAPWPAAAQAPGDARWNALYDRIVRLEHELRQMKRHYEQRIRRLEERLGRQRGDAGRGAAPRQRAAADDDMFAPLPPLAEPRLRVELEGADMATRGTAPGAPAPRARSLAPAAGGGPIALPGAGGGGLAAPLTPDGGGLAPGRVEARTLPPVGGAPAGTAAEAPARAAVIAPELANLSARELLQKGRENFLARRYARAEQAYRAWLARFGTRPEAAQVRYELGEALYVQGRFKEAGRAYVQVYQQHPESRLAPAALLRLGQALRRMGRKKEACKTWETLRRRFPDSRQATRGVPREMKRAGCKRG